MGATRYPYRPGAVAEVPLELAFDRRGGKRRELEVAIRIESLDSFEHPELGHLQQIVERLAPVRVATSEVRRQRLVRLDELVAQPSLAGLAVFDEPREECRPLRVACLLPPTHGGALVNLSAPGCPGAMTMALVVAGALPASSRATITIGSEKV